MAFGDFKGALHVELASVTNPTTAVGDVAVNVAVGDLVYGVFAQQTAVTVTVASDNLGNTYTALQAGTDAGTVTGRAYYSRVTVAGDLTEIYFTATASANNVAVSVIVIEGSFNASPLDANPTQITSDVTSPYVCPASGVLAQADEIIIAWGVGTGGTAWAADSPNIIADSRATATILHVDIGWQVVAVTTSVSPAFSGAATTQSVLGTSSFKKLLAVAAIPVLLMPPYKPR